jgi:NADPH-dependent curcumin reductase CurA
MYFLHIFLLSFIMCTESNKPNIVNNHKWILERRPEGVFHPEKDVKLVSEDMALECADDEVIVETEMLSADAFIRTMLDEEAYHVAIPLGGTLPSIGYGKVVHAGSATKYKVGSVVQGMLGAQTYSKVKATQIVTKFNFPFMSSTASLGIMGLTTGLTAYTGVFYVCDKPKKGETVVVTGAAGAVGSVAAQLAKSTGARGESLKFVHVYIRMLPLC